MPILTPPELLEAIAQAQLDFDKLHAIVHGSSTDPDVALEGGLVPTLAKVIADAQTTLVNLANAVIKSNEGFTVTVRTELKAFDSNAATLDNVTDVLATLLQTLQSKQVI